MAPKRKKAEPAAEAPAVEVTKAKKQKPAVSGSAKAVVIEHWYVHKICMDKPIKTASYLLGAHKSL